MKKNGRRICLYCIIAFLSLSIFYSSAFGQFPFNPIDPVVRNSNPLRDEGTYDYKYWKTNTVKPPTDPPNWQDIPANNEDRFKDIRVLGYRTNRSGANPTWYKERGWTISTHGLFRSRGGGHNGLDIAAPIDIPVYAVDAGSIYYGYQSGNYGPGRYNVNEGAGFLASMTHSGGMSTRYFHLLQFSYAFDPSNLPPIINGGLEIARSGGSGNATVYWNGSSYEVNPNAAQLGGPHLHFEVFQSGVRVDPLVYLPDPERPTANLTYVKLTDGQGLETVYSRKNGNLTNVIYTDYNGTIEVGGEFDDEDLLVSSITYTLKYGTSLRWSKSYTLQWIYAEPVSKESGRYHYLPEWKGVFLTSNFINRVGVVGVSTLDINPESLPSDSYDINPAAMPNIVFRFDEAIPLADVCDPTNVERQWNVELTITDSQGKQTVIPDFLVIKLDPNGPPPPQCPGDFHPDDNYDFASIHSFLISLKQYNSIGKI